MVYGRGESRYPYFSSPKYLRIPSIRISRVRFGTTRVPAAVFVCECRKPIVETKRMATDYVTDERDRHPEGKRSPVPLHARLADERRKRSRGRARDRGPCDFASFRRPPTRWRGRS